MRCRFRGCKRLEKARVVYSLLLLVAFWIAFLPEVAKTTEPTGTIRGRIYISPSGELDSPLVMFGKDVEVVLLSDDGTFDQKLREVRDAWRRKIEAQERVAQQAYDRVRASKSSKERVERAAVLTKERAQLARLKADDRTRVDALIGKYKTGLTKADGEGRFIFEGLAAGRYLLHARFEVLRTDQWYDWLVPTELQEGAQAEVELKKGNSSIVYYSD